MEGVNRFFSANLNPKTYWDQGNLSGKVKAACSVLFYVTIIPLIMTFAGVFLYECLKGRVSTTKIPKHAEKANEVGTETLSTLIREKTPSEIKALDIENKKVESGLKSSVHGKFSFRDGDQKIEFLGAYYFSDKLEGSYKRYLQIGTGFSEDGKRIDGHDFFGDDKIFVEKVKKEGNDLFLIFPPGIGMSKKNSTLKYSDVRLSLK